MDSALLCWIDRDKSSVVIGELYVGVHNRGRWIHADSFAVQHGYNCYVAMAGISKFKCLGGTDRGGIRKQSAIMLNTDIAEGQE